MISIDDLDKFIIKEIFYNNLGTWEITKKYYKELTNIKDSRERLNNKHRMVKVRLKKMAKYGFISMEKNSDRYSYTLDGNKVCFDRHKFLNKVYNTLSLRIYNGWCSYQL